MGKIGTIVKGGDYNLTGECYREAVDYSNAKWPMVELGAVCSFEYGKALKKENRSAGVFPVYGSNGIVGYHKDYIVEAPFIVVGRKGSHGKIVWSEKNGYPIDTAFYIKLTHREIDLKFLYFLIKNLNLDKTPPQSGVPGLNRNDAYKKKIPLPPLDIQKEIVKILDTFTELEAELETELETELEARKKQYEYYRNTLLTFGDGVVRWALLNETIDFTNGKGHENHIDENGKYIVVNSKFVSTEGKVKKYSKQQISPVFKGDILMVMSDLPNGRALAKCFYVDENNKYTLNQRICALTVKNKKELDSNYLFYILSRNRQLLRYDNGADQTNLRKDNILKIKIPIPPLAEQKRIVSILDKFDALVSDISIGLPAELVARRKQYEYYRNKLLTFRPLETHA